MGGSGGGGGGFSGRSNPSDLARQQRHAEAESLDAAFQVEVADLLAAELAQYNDRDTQAAHRLLDAVQADLAKDPDIESSVDLLFGGSVAKHTYVDGMSDVDALVLFAPGDAREFTPAELRDKLRDRLIARYGKDAVSAGNLAVTLVRNGVTLQLIPAMRAGDHFRISSSTGEAWSLIRPRNFAEALTRTNQKHDGKVVPCIKLAKALLGQLPEQRRLSGYHIESLAIGAFKDYVGEKTPKAMLVHFFKEAQRLVMSPMADSTGQSVHVDEYLGPAGSLQRQISADAIGRLHRRMLNADGAQSISLWRELFSGND